MAKKLLKSGAITAITKTPKRPEQAGFKRPRGLERKLSGTERTVSGYQPFSATHPEDMEPDNRPKVKVIILEVTLRFYRRISLICSLVNAIAGRLNQDTSFFTFCHPQPTRQVEI